MNERDSELEKMLSSLREMAPSELEENRWIKAMRQAVRRSAPPHWLPRTMKAYAAQLTAALLIGYFAGHLLERNDSTRFTNGSLEQSATIEFVSANAE